MAKHLTLMNFVDGYEVADNEKFFENELSWIIHQCGYNPGKALFISYAYDGKDYNKYFAEIKRITSSAGIKQITDIQTGNPATLLSNADMLIVGGGNLNQLVCKLDQLHSSQFNPYEEVRRLVEKGVPYVAWNEGCEITSNACIKPGLSINCICFEIAPHPVICNFKNNNFGRTAIQQFLETNPKIKQVVCQVERPKDTTTIRLEDVGTGMIDSIIGDPTLVITLAISNGQITEI